MTIKFNEDLMENPRKAWEIGERISPTLREDRESGKCHYMFMYASPDTLYFKHDVTRGYLNIRYDTTASS
tara:strand:- start:245 stop:454 length:210 start_codon:yes stop_codon:yes gene_type:complete